MKAAIKKIMKGEPEPTHFERLVDEALELYRSVSGASNRFGDARDEKLTREAYREEALRNARTTLAKIEALDKVVSKLREDENRNLLEFLNRATAQAAATRVDQGCDLRPPVGGLHHFVAYSNTRMVGVIVEANAIGSNPLELIALAAFRATRDHPENFGVIDDWDKHEAAREAKQSRLNALYQQIAEGWRDAPIEFDQIGSDGRALILVRFRGVVVPAAPPAALGERLCQALVALERADAAA